MIMISSTRRVNKIVGHGSPAVKSKSRSNRGVVITLGIKLTSMSCYGNNEDLPIDIAYIEDLAVSSTHARIAPPKLDLNGCEAQVGSHREVGNGGHHSD